MSAADNGGPAFPVADFDYQTFKPKTVDEARRLLSGMTLRDYFAAKAMHAHLITDTVPGEACDALIEAAAAAGRDPLDHIAFNAYECADAMLRAREPRPEPIPVGEAQESDFGGLGLGGIEP